MEKIQQAIERARQQRDGRIGTPAATAATTGLDRQRPGAIDLDAAPRFVVDAARARATRLVVMQPDAPHGDLFRMLRTQLLQRMRTLGARSIAVFSARDGEGKTLVACNLAASLARQSAGPVFLVDFDFRRPTVHDVFGLKVERGVSAVIEGSASIADVMQRCEGLPLYVLPQGRKHPAASELIAAPEARGLVQTLTSSFPDSVVVADCSPLLLTDEPLSVQQIVDSCLLVVQQGRTRRDEVQRAAELIDEAKYVGSVMNQVRESDLEQSYGYGYR